MGYDLVEFGELGLTVLEVLDTGAQESVGAAARERPVVSLRVGRMGVALGPAGSRWRRMGRGDYLAG
jgi:hypothetical protein